MSFRGGSRREPAPPFDSVPSRAAPLRRAAGAASLLLAGACASAEKDAIASLRQSLEAARAGDLDRAAELARAAHERRPGFVDPLLVLAEIEERRGDREAARAAYRQVLATDPTLTIAAMRLSGTYLVEKRFGEAEEWLLKAIEEDPGAEPAAFNLASLAEQRGAPDEAIGWLTLSAALDPRDPRSPTRIAGLHRRAGRLDAARAAAEEAVRRAPDYAPAQRELEAARAGNTGTSLRDAGAPDASVGR